MLPQLDAIRLVLEEEIAQTPNRMSETLKALRKNDAFQTQITWDVNVGGATVSGRAATTNPSVQNTDTVIGASLPIGNYLVDHTFSIPGTQLTQLGNLPANMAPRALRGLFAAHMQTAFDVIYPRLNALIWNGTGAGDTTNLQVFGMNYVITAANTYAGIAPGSYPSWVSYVNDNGGTPRPLSKELFAETEVEMFKRGITWNAIVTTPEIVKLYEALFDKNPGMPSSDVADITYSGYTYKGRPILTDKDATTGSWWFIDLSGVQFYSFAQGQYGLASPDPLLSVVSNPEKTDGINFLISQLPNTNPQAISYNISVMPQLKVHNRAKQICAIKDIDQDLAYISGDPDNTLVLPSPSPSP